MGKINALIFLVIIPISFALVKKFLKQKVKLFLHPVR